MSKNIFEAFYLPFEFEILQTLERGVMLIEQLNDCLTKNEKQLQYPLQVVQKHLRLFPYCNKKSKVNDYRC